MAALSAGDSILGMRPASSEGFGGDGGEFFEFMVMVVSILARWVEGRGCC